MILYYAAGGGLGHLTRGRALLHTLGIDAPVAMMTASRFAADRRVSGENRIVAIPSELAGDRAGYRRWLIEAIDRLAPEAIYLDAFPAGILGEFAGFPFPPNVPLYHVARILRWDAYRPLPEGALPLFDATYVTEPLASPHEEAVAARSGSMLPIDLIDPPVEAGLPPIVTDEARNAPLWLVVHSGPDDEIGELLDYASQSAGAEGIEPRIVLVAPSSPAGASGAISRIDFYPARLLFPHADRIITGCGFNAMRQTLPWRSRHRFIPFPRRYDDQYLRAARRRALI